MCEFCGNASIKERIKQWLILPLAIVFFIKELLKEYKEKKGDNNEII